MANRTILNIVFAAGIRNATLKVAEGWSGNAFEAIRVVKDAVRCVDSIEFLGLSSSRNPGKALITTEKRNGTRCQIQNLMVLIS
jgi:hypothetical protein